MKNFNLDELVKLTGTAKRTIRFYMQKGLVDAPFGARKTARYTQTHVEQLLKIKQWKEAGLNLSRIADLLNGTEAPRTTVGAVKPGDVSYISRIFVADGVHLDIDKSRVSVSDEDLRALSQMVSEFFMQTGSKNDDE